jgi:hypothetical protein
MQEIGVNKAKFSFVLDFRNQVVQEARHVPLSELSLGELLYRVLVGGDDVRLQQTQV